MRILHTADLHMGKKTHGKMHSERLMNDRLIDVERVGYEIADIAEREEVDVILFAGDAFDTTTPTPTQQRLLLDVFHRWQEVAMVLMVPGNHDHPVTEGRNHAMDIFEELDYTYVYSEPEAFVYDDVVFCALPWPLKRLKGEHDSVWRRYMDVMQKATDNAYSRELPAVLFGHLTAKGSLPSGSEASLSLGGEITFAPEELSEGFDYVGLGHIHKPQDLSKNAPLVNCPVVYSGSPERLTFNEEDNDPSVVIFDTEDSANYWRVPIESATSFYTIDADVNQEEDITKQPFPKEAIVRIRYQSDHSLDEQSILREVSDKCRRVVEITRLVDDAQAEADVPDIDVNQDPVQLFRSWANKKSVSSSDQDEALELLTQLTD